MLLKEFTFHAPKTVDEAVKLYSTLDNVKIQAGGTFLLNSLKLSKRKGTRTPDHVLCLRKVDGLNGLSLDGDTLTIRAMTTIDEIFDSPLLTDNFAVLKTVCRNISTQPIRNMATIGGNLTCRYTWTEMPAAIIGLGAKMHFMDSDGKEVTVDPEEFYNQGAKSSHLFTHITIRKDTQCRIAYRRVKKSQFVDIPLLSLMIKTTFKDNQFTNTVVAVNNCVTFARRDNVLETFLNGNRADDAKAQEALDHLDNPIYDTRSTDYKKHMFRTCIKSAVEELTAKPS